MAVLSYIVGGSGFGLAARFWQLAIMKRNMFDNPGAHALSMAFWGGAGYWLYFANQRNEALLAKKKEQLRQLRAISLGELAPEDFKPNGSEEQ